MTYDWLKVVTEKSDVAYCGLYCGDCIIRTGEMAELSSELLERMKRPEFRKLGMGLPKLMPEQFKGLENYEACYPALEAMSRFDCQKTCRDGGGSRACQIRDCCLEANIEGCWVCDDYDGCDILAWLNPVHGDAHLLNIKIIRENGMKGFLEGTKHW